MCLIRVRAKLCMSGSDLRTPGLNQGNADVFLIFFIFSSYADVFLPPDGINLASKIGF